MEIEETARTGTVGRGDTRSGWKHRDWVPHEGDPPFWEDSTSPLTHRGTVTVYIFALALKGRTPGLGQVRSREKG